MRAKPTPPSARPCPIAAGRARVAASPKRHKPESRDATTEAAQSATGAFATQNGDDQGCGGGGGGGGASEPSSVLSRGQAGPRAPRLQAGQGRFPASRPTRPDETTQVWPGGARCFPLQTPSPPRPPFRLASPQATPKGRRAPAPTSNQLRSLRRRPPQRAKPRPLATRAAMKKPRSEKPCPQSVPLTYRTGSVTAETRRGP